MKTLALFAGLALIGAAPAYACSVQPNYRAPTNFDLMKKADLVVLARVTGGPDASSLTAEDWDKPQVTLEPIRALKGELSEEPLALLGYVSSGEKAVVQHPTPLHRAHPTTAMGACIRQEYAVGALVVAVFQKNELGWRQESSPFARSVEDVEGEQGTWVRAAETYIGFAAIANLDERRNALEAEAARLLALTDDSAAPAIAADLLEAAANEMFD